MPTTTVYAPDTVEGQIEAAYLASWDAYAEACLSVDVDGLTSFYADEALEYRRADIDGMRTAGRAARCEVEHDYVVEQLGAAVAVVSDNYISHLRLIDPDTGAFLEADPNIRDGSVYTLERRGDRWLITDINALQ
jgi:hypothetical protein